ncbi:carboxymuconolactone decarboxylase family protein [Dyella sp. GSA-30]|uniref:carboxymuconolactone decarboxylase family protein n=1 Tax=Dyella sp. GSA-30 TaxID=2994496 RepID=UPI0024906CFD|nr:carboxymuconolactone decarboxylase family protein [Dyella sp. GSA-30]BDU22187.1 alkyl hydroperoxide reductase AhpD [Dyella sp. GSA-30]
MSRIAIPALEAATGATAEVYAQIKAGLGNVPNTFAAIGALQPVGLKAMMDVERALTAGSLSLQEQEIINIVVSHASGCDYCESAHVHLGKRAGLTREALWQIRHGGLIGHARHDALLIFVRILLNIRGTVSEASIAAVRAAGYTDIQLAEISLAIALITFTNTFNRINNTELDFPRID